MLRRPVAKLILVLSLLAGTLAWAGFVALNTVLDPQRSEDVADALYEDDAVRDRIADNMAAALGRAVPDEAGVTDEQLEGAARAALASPAVRTLVIDGLIAVHRGFLGEGEVPEALDAGAVGAVAREALVAAVPDLGSVLPPAPQLSVPLPTERVPDASPLRQALEVAVPFLALVAVGGIALALIATNDRPSVLGAAGRRAIAVSAGFLILAFGVPALARALAPDQAEIVAALVGALVRTTVVPALVLAGGGVAALVAAAAWRRRGGRAPQASEPRPRPAPRPAPPRPAPVRETRAVGASRPARPPAPEPRQPAPPAGPPADRPPRPRLTRPPTWVDGVGWVLHPEEPSIPERARWVPGRGYVVDDPDG